MEKIEATTYEPSLIGVYAFTGTARVVMRPGGRPGEVEITEIVGADPLPGAKLRSLPVAEPRPYLPEGFFGSVPYAAEVRDLADGGIEVISKSVGNYSNWYDGPRGGTSTRRLPAWYVRAVRTALDRGACIVEMTN